MLNVTKNVNAMAVLALLSLCAAYTLLTNVRDADLYQSSDTEGNTKYQLKIVLIM